MPLSFGVCLGLVLAGSSVEGVQTQRFRAGTEAVPVYVSVLDRDGRPITGLGADRFEVFDNGKPRTVSTFSGDPQPTAIALVLDRSGSLRRQMTAVAQAAGTFVQKLLPGDRASVATLNFLCQRMTGDTSALTKLLARPLPYDVASPVWSAVDRTLTTLDREAGRHAMLLFSDGVDNTDRRTMDVVESHADEAGACARPDVYVAVDHDEAAHHAARNGSIVYGISVDANQGMNLGDIRNLAKQTGGDTYILRSETDLTAAFLRILDELHHQYLLGFVPESFDGKVHSLEVKVKTIDVIVRARKSYVAVKTPRMR